MVLEGHIVGMATVDIKIAPARHSGLTQEDEAAQSTGAIIL